MRRFMLFALLLSALALATGAGAAGNKVDRGHDDGRGQKSGQEGESGDDEGDDGEGRGGSRQRGARTFGPYTIVTTDNGSCGNPWATDTIRRTYTVRPNGNGTFTLLETDRGTFTTLGGVSPGACNDTGSYPAQPDNRDHGRTVLPGIQGTMAGYIAGVVSCGASPCTFNQAGAVACGTTPATSPCYRDVFVAAAFGPTATFSCSLGQNPCSYRFDYFSSNPTLIYRHWTDQGTGTTERFSGDIANA